MSPRVSLWTPFQSILALHCSSTHCINLSYDKGYSFFNIHFWHQYTQDHPFCILPFHYCSASTCYAFCLDVASWLSGATARPAVPYLVSVPVSFPLIGLTQLVQYLVVCHVANLTPSKLCSQISGATGHSQGIVSAVGIAASGTFEEFTKNSRKALKWLFYSGLRGQQAFPVTSVEPSIIQDAVTGGKGTPSPMLSIAGVREPWWLPLELFSFLSPS